MFQKLVKWFADNISKGKPMSVKQEIEKLVEAARGAEAARIANSLCDTAEKYADLAGTANSEAERNAYLTCYAILIEQITAIIGDAATTEV